MSIRTTFKQAIWATAYYSGAAHLAYQIKPSFGSIVCLHRILPHQFISKIGNNGIETSSTFFESWIRYLLKHQFEFVDLDTCLHRLQNPQTPNGSKHPFVSIGFDDGYKDNFTYAYPILKRFNIPFTIYLTTDFAEGRAQLWWYLLEELLIKSTSVPTLNQKTQLPCGSIKQKREVFSQLRLELRAASSQERDAYFLQKSFPSLSTWGELTKAHCLTWDEIRTMALDPLVTFGCHTKSHPQLSTCSPETLEEELKSSREIISQNLGRDIAHLAYPFGDRESCGTREFAKAKSLGFGSGVTTVSGVLHAGAAIDLYQIPRIILREDLALRGFWVQASGISNWKTLFQRHHLAQT